MRCDANSIVIARALAFDSPKQVLVFVQSIYPLEWKFNFKKTHTFQYWQFIDTTTPLSASMDGKEIKRSVATKSMLNVCRTKFIFGLKRILHNMRHQDNELCSAPDRRPGWAKKIWKCEKTKRHSEV